MVVYDVDRFNFIEVVFVYKFYYCSVLILVILVVEVISVIDIYILLFFF